MHVGRIAATLRAARCALLWREGGRSERTVGRETCPRLRLELALFFFLLLFLFLSHLAMHACMRDARSRKPGGGGANWLSFCWDPGECVRRAFFVIYHIWRRKGETLQKDQRKTPTGCCDRQTRKLPCRMTALTAATVQLDGGAARCLVWLLSLSRRRFMRS